MEMKKYIEEAEKKAGTKKKLAEILGITTRYINMAKNKERCLSVDTCIVLADYIEADRLEIIAASNLATEKDEKKRKILESCFSSAATVAAAALILGASTIVSPSPANASQASNNTSDICIMLNNNRRNKLRRKSDKFVTADSYFETTGQII